MIKKEDHPVAPGHGVAANDNGTAEDRIGSAVLTVARLVGRQIARGVRASGRRQRQCAGRRGARTIGDPGP